jgi:hypothetical protein
VLADQRAKPRDARHDENGVRQRAKQAQDENVLALQTLAQDEGVLRADCHDQRNGQHIARQCGCKHRLPPGSRLNVGDL